MTRVGDGRTTHMLEELFDKYAEMLAMRRAHDDRTEDARAVRPRMAALAARYPGALREIDDLELVEIRARLDELDAALHGRRPIARWMIAVGRFHALARGALCAKRWLRGRKRVDDDLRRAFVASVPTMAFSEDAAAWASELERIATPPGGRLTSVVMERVAAELASTHAEARLLVFGISRRARKRARVTPS